MKSIRKAKISGPAQWRLIGMVHLPPLPGSPRAGGFARVTPLRAIEKRAVEEARLLAHEGFGALIVENFGDSPFAAERVSRETIAAMSLVVSRVVEAVQLPVGINVLRNDALSALAVAAATGAAFIRVNVLSGVYATDQGLIVGCARELLEKRTRLATHVRIAADIHVKHATPLSQPDVTLAAEETAHRGGADVLIVSGPTTGRPTEFETVCRVKAMVPDRPLWIGSGVTAETVGDYLAAADGVIVGTALKRGGKTTNPLDPARVRELVRAATR